MSSSEDDYMSDTFLSQCVKNDIRPGLIHGQSQKRDHDILKKKLENNENKLKSRRKDVVENETRETALNEPISADNKGFAMLQKLGFKPGSGLGKSSSGRKEPVQIQLKTDRQGLGRAEAIRERRVELAAARKAIHDKLTNVADYRCQLAEKTAERRACIDLRKSQRICLQLDQNDGISEPDQVWYWPKGALNEEDIEEEEEDDVNNRNELDETSAHEAEFDDEDDENAEEPAQQKLQNIVDNSEEYSVTEKLEILTNYLRKKHCYCIWCAVHFDDEDDLRRECPGPTYQDH